MTNEFVILDGKLKLTNIDGWVVDMSRYGLEI